MAQSFFIWNGRDCRSMGIHLTGPAPIVRPEERVQHVEIPGRAGDLTQTEGDDIYNSYIQTVTIHVKGGFHVREVYNWLKGSGYVTFSGEPNVRQQARIIGAITLNKHSRNLDTWVGTVQFYCQPFKERLRDEPETITESGTKVYNFGDITARPYWKVTASGANVSITAGGKTIEITHMQQGWIIWLDSETMEMLDTTQTGTLTHYASGDFPVLLKGENEITGSGWSEIILTKRERFL